MAVLLRLDETPVTHNKRGGGGERGIMSKKIFLHFIKDGKRTRQNPSHEKESRVRLSAKQKKNLQNDYIVVIYELTYVIVIL